MSTQSHYTISLPSSAEPLPSIGSPSVRRLSLPGGPLPDATSNISSSQGRDKNQTNARALCESYRHATTIGTLPDNVLLQIFDFFQKSHKYFLRPVWEWHLLVHVCQRWRQIIFASPHRLNLEILCTYGTPVRDNLGIWPALPIVIDYRYSLGVITPDDEDNVIAALEHPDRVCYLGLTVAGSLLGKMATVMQKPFPVLICLDIISGDGNVPVLPAEFLGGSAPCLQKITLSGIPYPSLPKLLLSTSDLIDLHLHNIPPTGYISPEAMVAALAALPRLEIFSIEFQLATPRPHRIQPSPITRAILPSLTSFQFRGVSEYLEDLAAQVDCPRVNGILIDYLNQLVNFQTTQLSKFINRSVGPELTLFEHAHVTFLSDFVTFSIYPRANHPSWNWRSATTIISCEGIDWQVSHMAQVLSHFSAILPTVVHLRLEVRLREGRQLEGMDDVEWLHLLHPFFTLQTLYVSHELAGHVSLALESTTGGVVTEVLPSLDLICLEGQPASSIEKLVAIRELSGRPVTVADTTTEFDQRLEAYFSK